MFLVGFTGYQLSCFQYIINYSVPSSNLRGSTEIKTNCRGQVVVALVVG